jgi:hypothetical protein
MKPTPDDKKKGFSIVKRQLLEKIPQHEIELAKEQARQNYNENQKELIYAPAVLHLDSLESWEIAQSAHYIITTRNLIKYVREDSQLLPWSS